MTKNSVISFLGSDIVIGTIGFIYGSSLIYKKCNWEEEALLSSIQTGVNGSIYSTGACFIGNCLQPYGLIVTSAMIYSIIHAAIKS